MSTDNEQQTEKGERKKIEKRDRALVNTEIGI